MKSVPMTVRQLIKELSAIENQDQEVLLPIDDEGNGFRELCKGEVYQQMGRRDGYQEYSWLKDEDEEVYEEEKDGAYDFKSYVLIG